MEFSCKICYFEWSQLYIKQELPKWIISKAIAKWLVQIYILQLKDEARLLRRLYFDCHNFSKRLMQYLKSQKLSKNSPFVRLSWFRCKGESMVVRFLQVSGKAHVHESCSTLQGGGVDVGGGGVLESGASTVLDQLKKERKQLWRKTKLSFFRLVWKQQEPI